MIEVRNLGRKFEIFKEQRSSLYDYLFDKKHSNETIWALKNINFDLKKGEVLGVIGKNGSGKSTLLKILAGVLQPTEGTVSVSGRVLPLLELGIGFEAELTGVENINLYGTILGLTKKEINQKLESVTNFADIGSFINAKLKTYSSGMVARLAFSTALMIEPDVLLIDEILSVGDEEFQKKSLKKMLDFKKEGKTIVFVSHSTDNIRLICDKCLFLDKNSRYVLGDTDEAIETYLKTSYSEKKLQLYQAIEKEDSPDKLKELFKQAEDLLDHKISFLEKQIIDRKIDIKKMLIFNDKTDNLNLQEIQKQKNQIKNLISKRADLIKEKKEIFYNKMHKNIEKKETLANILSLVHWEIKFNKTAGDIEQLICELKTFLIKNREVIVSKSVLERFKNLIDETMNIINDASIKLRIISYFKDTVINLQFDSEAQKLKLINMLIQKQIRLIDDKRQKQELIKQMQEQLEEHLQKNL